MSQARSTFTSELRSYTLQRSGHFEAAHYLPGYPGRCATLHGHRWEVTATVEFPVVPRQMVSHEDPDVCGMLVDFADISEIWKEYDHPDYGPLNEVIPNPTAEVIANILLEALRDLVQESLSGFELPFNCTITLLEGPDSSVTVSVYQPSFVPTEREWMEQVGGGEPWLGYAGSNEPCNCPACVQEREGAPSRIQVNQVAGTVEQGAKVVGVSL